MRALAQACLGALAVVLFPPDLLAQVSRSAAIAKELAQALDAAKLDSIAARDPSTPDLFFAALYFPGSQLLVISARYSVPQLLESRLLKKEYRDIYLDLNGAAIPNSRVFIEDPGADGLQPDRAENQPFDTYEAGGKRTMFDGKWGAQDLKEEDYLKTFAEADARYVKILMAFLAQTRPGS
jgi:hypothetical protein